MSSHLNLVQNIPYDNTEYDEYIQDDRPYLCLFKVSIIYLEL